MPARILSVWALLGLLALASGCTRQQVDEGEETVNDAHNTVTLLAALTGAAAPVATDEPAVVVFELRNAGTTGVSVLTWGTPLEDAFTREIFTVTRDGQPVAYRGRTVKRGEPGADDFLELSPGQALSASLDLRDGYALDEPGIYSVALNLPLLTLRQGATTAQYPLTAPAPASFNIE